MAGTTDSAVLENFESVVGSIGAAVEEARRQELTIAAVELGNVRADLAEANAAAVYYSEREQFQREEVWHLTDLLVAERDRRLRENAATYGFILIALTIALVFGLLVGTIIGFGLS